MTVVGVCAVWEVVRLLQEWHKDEEATAEAQDKIRESASSSSSELPPYPRMRQLVTCALLRWSCFTLLALSLILFRLRFNDHKPARCCDIYIIYIIYSFDLLISLASLFSHALKAQRCIAWQSLAPHTRDAAASLLRRILRD